MSPIRRASILIGTLCFAIAGCTEEKVEQPVKEEAPTEPPAPEAVPVTVGRKLRLNERWLVDRRRVTDTLTVDTVDGKAPVEQRAREETSFKGEGQVSSVDDKGDEKTFEYVVAAFSHVAKEKEWSLAAGTKLRVVRAAKREDALVEIDGRPANDDEREAISAFVSFTPAIGTHDDLYGSATPRRIGEKWQPHLDVFAKGLLDSGLIVLPEKVSGSVELLAIERHPAGAELRVGFQVSSAEIRVDKVPPGIEVRPASLHMSGTIALAPDAFINKSSTKIVSVFETIVTKEGQPKRTYLQKEEKAIETNDRIL